MSHSIKLPPNGLMDLKVRVEVRDGVVSIFDLSIAPAVSEAVQAAAAVATGATRGRPTSGKSVVPLFHPERFASGTLATTKKAADLSRSPSVWRAPLSCGHNSDSYSSNYGCKICQRYANAEKNMKGGKTWAGLMKDLRVMGRPVTFDQEGVLLDVARRWLRTISAHAGDVIDHDQATNSTQRHVIARFIASVLQVGQVETLMEWDVLLCGLLLGQDITENWVPGAAAFPEMPPGLVTEDKHMIPLNEAARWTPRSAARGGLARHLPQGASWQDTLTSPLGREDSWGVLRSLAVKRGRSATDDWLADMTGSADNVRWGPESFEGAVAVRALREARTTVHNEVLVKCLMPLSMLLVLDAWAAVNGVDDAGAAAWRAPWVDALAAQRSRPSLSSLPLALPPGEVFMPAQLAPWGTDGPFCEPAPGLEMRDMSGFDGGWLHGLEYEYVAAAIAGAIARERCQGVPVGPLKPGITTEEVLDMNRRAQG